jgi:hypothetical protein
MPPARNLKMKTTELIMKSPENKAKDYSFEPAANIEKAGTR